MAIDTINLTGIDANRPSSPALTRRALFGATGKVAAVSTLAGLPALAVARNRRAEWDGAVRRFDTAEAISEAYDKAKLDPAFAAYKAACLPDALMTWTLPADDDGPEYTSDMNRHVLKLLTGPDYDRVPAGSAIIDAARRLAADKAKVDDFNRAANARLGVDAMCDESERLGELAWKARDVLVLIPAPDLAALAYKLRLTIRFDMLGESFQNGDPQASLLADTERLSGGLN